MRRARELRPRQHAQAATQDGEWIAAECMGDLPVALTAVDKTLLQRCLSHEPGAWNDFVDRYLSLIYHVVHYTAHLRSVSLAPEDVEDISAEVLLQFVANDYGVLRQFRGQSSLATYLTVVGRRICGHELTRRNAIREKPHAELEREDRPNVQAGLESVEQVQRLLRKLPTREREVVRLFYLEGRSYEEISAELRIPVNTIGPVLSRAKKRLRGSEGTKKQGIQANNGAAQRPQ
jgi:RNA polymerase sigma-70 factor, ECF subfamily